MSKKSNPLDYLTFNKKQGDNFLKEVEKIVLNELTKTGKQNSIHQFDNNKFKKYGFYVEVINGIKSPLKDYYLLRKDIFNPLSQNTDYVCKAISYKTIEKFMGDYFPNYDLGNPENNAIDIGKLEKITLQEIKERNLNHPNSEVKEIAPVSDTNTHFDPEFIKSRLEKNEYAMYTYGERYINSEGGDDKPRRIFYLKERPVLLKNGQIFLKNTDDIEIVFHPKYRLRKGIKVIPNETQYEGDYQVFERRNKGGKSIVYLETGAMKSRNNRHFKIMLSFGEGISEIAIGTFTSIKDSGTLLAGAALLVRKEKGFFQDNACKIYTTFKDSPLHSSVRMLLERRSRTYVKLPKQLEIYTIDGLNENLFRQKSFERDNWESREPSIHRKDVFVSIPLRCNGNSKYKNNVELLDTFTNILQNPPFDLTKITYGIIKHKSTPANQLPSSKDEYESNFEKIIQSNFVVFLFPPINFPYEEKGIKAQLNQEITKISTSFIELGYALGLRKKILILTSEKVNKVLPSVVGEFAKGGNISIIECDFSSLKKFEDSVNIHEREISKFIDKHVDYEVVGN